MSLSIKPHSSQACWNPMPGYTSMLNLALYVEPCTCASGDVQVGSFEEVIMRMSSSTGNELAAWSQVMFVAPSLLQQAVLKDEAANKK